MKTYVVTLTKIEQYIVEANSVEEAEELGLEQCYNDKMAFALDPVDSIEVEEM
jgi:hypothetical protein